MRLLFVGDVVGKAGRRALERVLPGLRSEHGFDLVVVNGENAAGGVGITPSTADELFAAGADVITLGNHAFRHREIYPYLDERERILRPSNFMHKNPGHGHCVVEAGGMRVAVVNLMGAVGLTVAREPFADVDSVLDRLEGRADAVVVDFHAEVTSEKIAMGWHLDGRVGAVLGTHTHVPTADARVLPKGTAFICDVGMTGARGGVLGASREDVLERFTTQMPVRFGSAEQDVWLNAVTVELGADGLATSIEQLLVELDSLG